MRTPSPSISSSKPLSSLPLRLLLLLLVSLFSVPTFATTTIHYYQVPSCNTGTDVGEYDAPLNATASDSTCHSLAGIAAAGIKALYINGLDDNCAIIAYTDPNCSPKSAYANKLATKGQCFYLDDYGVISSWSSVCGDQLAAASSSLAAEAPVSTSTGMSGSGNVNATAAATMTKTAITATATASSNAAAVPQVASLGSRASLTGLVSLLGAVVVMGLGAGLI